MLASLLRFGDGGLNMTSLMGTASTGRFKRAHMAALATAVLYGVWRRWRDRPRGATFMPGHWLLGNLPQFLQASWRKEQLDFLCEQHRHLGRTLAMKFPFTSWWVVTTRPENVEHILVSNFANYPKGPWWQSKLFDLLGNGIFNADGQAWHQQRKTASRMFTANLFKEHIWVVVRRNARKLRDLLESTKPGQQVDIFNLMNRFTLDTIGEIGFGKCIGSLEDPSSPFLQSFDKAQQIAFQRFVLPVWRPLRWLGIGHERETRKHFQLLDEYSHSVAQDLRKGLSRDSGRAGIAWEDIESRKSFIGLFLQDAQKRGEELSDDYLRDLVLNFLIAGRDTTAQALSWAIYLLCMNPECEAKARREIRDVCGVRGPAYDDMSRLRYVQAVLSESLRLFPSVPLDAKYAQSDDVLPDGTVVPRGTTVFYNLYSMGRDHAIWGEDAEVFRPERWLEMESPPSNYAYPVFNAGPRECLGRRLAIVEMKTCLAMILPELSFRLAIPADQVMPDAQLTIGMSRGLPCTVVRASEAQEVDDLASTASAVGQSRKATSSGSCTSEFAVDEEEDNADSDGQEEEKPY
mmetsp:Transcript_86853/g.172414  ORF Transcript_86853/g.172414 Transcript_86853/m.172414 type:complete len:575 (+) Transcript_86853:72-1796(+)